MTQDEEVIASVYSVQDNNVGSKLDKSDRDDTTAYTASQPKGKALLRNLNPTRLGTTPIGVNTRKAIDKATEQRKTEARTRGLETTQQRAQRVIEAKEDGGLD